MTIYEGGNGNYLSPVLIFFSYRPDLIDLYLKNINKYSESLAIGYNILKIDCLEKSSEIVNK